VQPQLERSEIYTPLQAKAKLLKYKPNWDTNDTTFTSKRAQRPKPKAQLTRNVSKVSEKNKGKSKRQHPLASSDQKSRVQVNL